MAGLRVSGDDQYEVKGGRLLAATLLNLFISFAEIIGGIISNSLALVSDALHNLTDGLAIFIAWVANKISRKPSDLKRTFGYKRIEILAALLNAVILVSVSGFLIYEAIKRIIEPEPVRSGLMMLIAGIGLLANLAAVFLLRGDSGKNINIRAAYLHLLGDTMTSVAVIAGGALIYFYNIYWLDPAITILISLYILKETWVILRQTNDILMQGVPAGLDLEQVRTDIEKLPAIANIHHVHIWNLDDRAIHFECHVELKRDFHLSELNQIQSDIESILKEKYDITHVTLQFEYRRCDDHSLIAR